MKLKRILTLTAAAALTTALLTGCPWEQDDAASSEPSSSSSSSSRPSHDSDSGDDDSSAPPEQEETGPGYVEVKDETGKVTKYEVSNENGLRTWAQAVKENPALDCTLAGGIVGYNDDGSIMDCYWQAGTGGPEKGIGQDDNNQSEPTKVEANGWEQYKENLEEYSITIMDGKPVPNVIKENGTVALPETVQRVLDAAWLFGL